LSERKERKVTTRKKKTPDKGGARKLKLKKETIRDLDAKKAGKDVKGGLWGVPATIGCKTADCPVNKTASPPCAILI